MCLPTIANYIWYIRLPMLSLNYDPRAKAYKFEQVRDEIIRNIGNGNLKKDALLPSITEICEQYQLSQVTVARAYLHLKNQGYITYIASKGFYVTGDRKQQLKILLVFNKLSYYKKLIYYGFLEVAGSEAKVDLQVHHYDVETLNNIIEDNLGKYDYYAVMPHFRYEAKPTAYLDVFTKIPAGKLIVLDKKLPMGASKHLAVYQDFETDVYDGLEAVADLLKKYKKLTVIIPTYSNHPLEIVRGVKKFCRRSGIECDVIDNASKAVLKRGNAFIVIEEEELAILIKGIRQTNLKLGTNIGIISFNETVLKELLGITVFSTNFTAMGRVAAMMMLENQTEQVRNHFEVIRRQSL